MKNSNTPASAPSVQEAPLRLKLLVTVVNRNKAEFYCDFLQSFEVNFQTVLTAEGTADNDTVRLLGLNDTSRCVIFSVIREDRATAIMEALGDKFRTIKNGKGIAYTIPMSGTIGVAVYRFLANAHG
jgi:hypothetical protein